MKKKKSMQAPKGSKKAGSFQFNNACENPICMEAQEFIDEFYDYVDDYTLFIIKDSFCGFNEPTQQKMVRILQYVFNGIDIENAVVVFPSTGIQHVDLLLSELIYKINISMDNFAYYEH